MISNSLTFFALALGRELERRRMVERSGGTAA
jgi:hypothetical protein